MTGALHPLLQRQLENAGFHDQQLPDDPAGWQRLLQSISDVYTQGDEARTLLEQSLRASDSLMLHAARHSQVNLRLGTPLDATLEAPPSPSENLAPDLLASLNLTDYYVSDVSRHTTEVNYRRLFLAAERQAIELTLLDQARNAIAREVELPVILRAVVEAIADAFGYTHVSSYLLQDGYLYLQHQVGYQHVIDKIPIVSGVAGRVVRTAQPVFLEDAHTDPDFLEAVPDLVSEICVPLLDKDKVAGILNVESTNGMKLSPDDLKLIMALSEHINIAIERAGLYAELRTSAARMRHLVEILPDMLMRLRRDGTVLEVKSSGGEFGPMALPDGSIGKKLADFLSPDMTADILEHAEAAFTTRQLQVYDHQFEQNGKLHDLEIRMVAFNQEEALLIVRDITEREEMGRQTLLMEVQRERREVHTRFIKDASHEFRTPLSILKTNLALLEMVIEPDRRTRLLEQMDSQVEGILRLIEALVTLSQLDGDIDFEDSIMPINGIVDEVCTAMRRTLQEHQIELQLAPNLPLVRVDVLRLHQALQMILENAVRYAPPASTIQIRTYAEGQHVVIEIHNVGRGIKAEDLPHIFERFYRGDAAHTSPGFGLGLAISQGIIERLNGQIQVASPPGEGTTFWVRLPALET